MTCYFQIKFCTGPVVSIQVTSIQVNSVEVETVSRTWLKEHGIFNPSQHSGIASIKGVCLSNGESIVQASHP